MFPPVWLKLNVGLNYTLILELKTGVMLSVNEDQRCFRRHFNIGGHDRVPVSNTTSISS